MKGTTVQEPQVSVILPVFNATQTLKVALASLRMQRGVAWECVIVDDGSRVPIGNKTASLRDPRIRIVSLSENRGRGAARQAGLEAARGEWVTFLDADDWCYPGRFRLQLEALQSEPEIDALSCGFAIVGPHNDLRGIRGVDPAGPEIVHSIAADSLPFAPTWVGRELALRVGFDPRLRRGEDRDFLVRLAKVAHTASLNRALYAYSEYASNSASRVLGTLAGRAQVARRDHFSRSSIIDLAETGLKSLGGLALIAAGRGDLLVQRRSREPNVEEHARHRMAVRALNDAMLQSV